MNTTFRIAATVALLLAGALAATLTPTPAEARGNRGDGFGGAGSQHGPASLPVRSNYSYGWSHGYYTDYRGYAQPWTPAWYSQCSAKYRSFNPQTGYFMGYDGNRHFCR